MRMSGSTAPRSNWGCAKRWRFPGTALIWPASTGPTTRCRTAAAEGPAKPARRTKVTKVLHVLLRATVKFLSVKSISEMLVQNKSMGRPEPIRDRNRAATVRERRAGLRELTFRTDSFRVLIDVLTCNRAKPCAAEARPFL